MIGERDKASPNSDKLSLRETSDISSPARQNASATQSHVCPHSLITPQTVCTDPGRCGVGLAFQPVADFISYP
jgi:hypothetical protein